MENRKMEKTDTIGDKVVKFILPSVGQLISADIEYSKGYTNALKAGIWPRMKMEKFVEENALWTEEDEKKLEEKDREFKDLFAKNLATEDQEKRDAINLEMAKVRNEVLSIFGKKQSLYLNTAETKGEEAKIASLIPLCCRKEDGSAYWNSFDEFKGEKDKDFGMEIVRIFMMFLSNMEDALAQTDSVLNRTNVEEPEAEKVEEVPAPEEEKKKEEVAV